MCVRLWLKARGGRVTSQDNMAHHTPGNLCQAEQLLCFYTALPWMWLANTEVSGENTLFHSHKLNKHFLTHQ